MEEGISQTGREVTAVVAENFLSGDTSAAIMCKAAGADLFPVDIGIARDTKLRDEKIAYGTKNMAREWAMTRAQAVCAIETGIRMAEELAEKGYEILATGEDGDRKYDNKQRGSSSTVRKAGRRDDRQRGRTDKCGTEAKAGSHQKSSGIASTRPDRWDRCSCKSGRI